MTAHMRATSQRLIVLGTNLALQSRHSHFHIIFNLLTLTLNEPKEQKTGLTASAGGPRAISGHQDQ